MTQVSVNKPERVRLREPREEREPGAVVIVPGEQGRMFAQLLAGEGEGQGFASTMPAATAHTDALMLEAFTEQLIPRLNGASQWPLQAAFYLPRLGRINVSARHEHGTWSIGLDADEERTQGWLTSVRQGCQDRLARAFGQPVDVQLVATGAA